MENFTAEEKDLLIHIGYLVLDNGRLSEKILNELFEDFDIEAGSTADSLLEKLTDLV